MEASARLILLLLVSIGLAATSYAQEADCASCHDTAETLAKSAHANVACLQCHPKHEEYPHPEGLKPATCASCHERIAAEFAASVHGQELAMGNQGVPECSTCHGSAHEAPRARTAEFHSSSLDTCGMCHAEVLAEFEGSVHGAAARKGVLDAPVCSSCHGAHSIQRSVAPSAATAGPHIRETCGRCHGDLRLTSRFGLPADRVTSFDASFHGLAGRAGSQRVANCASCHGYHSILPSSDPRSTVHPRNLGETCGSCHPGAGRRFTISTIHVSEEGHEPGPVRLARIFYLMVIPLTIGLMVLHHGGDWVRKLVALRFRGPAGAGLRIGSGSETRMHRAERIQHMLLLISFFVLVWTGFALRYPDAFWAKPLVVWEARWPLRGWIHRAAGVVLIAVSILHVVTLVVNRKLRQHWLNLIPRRWDASQAAGMLLYNLGLRRKKPALSSHSYVEKVEYWAVVWGTALMALTGIALWSTNFMLAYFPKVWLDFAGTVHFYEAVLATLAILVWHFYTVIFDPEVYPMDTAWLTGKSPRLRKRPEAGEHSDGE